MTGMDAEIPLAGGCQTPGVVRVGETVRRPMCPRSSFVHELLRFLEAAGFGGAPRIMGVDERGREVLSFIEGRVPHGEEGRRLSDAHLVNAAALIRHLHDATAGSGLAARSQISWPTTRRDRTTRSSWATSRPRL